MNLKWDLFVNMHTLLISTFSVLSSVDHKELYTDFQVSPFFRIEMEREKFSEVSKSHLPQVSLKVIMI